MHASSASLHLLAASSLPARPVLACACLCAWLRFERRAKALGEEVERLTAISRQQAGRAAAAEARYNRERAAAQQQQQQQQQQELGGRSPSRNRRTHTPARGAAAPSSSAARPTALLDAVALSGGEGGGGALLNGEFVPASELAARVMALTVQQAALRAEHDVLKLLLPTDEIGGGGGGGGGSVGSDGSVSGQAEDDPELAASKALQRRLAVRVAAAKASGAAEGRVQSLRAELSLKVKHVKGLPEGHVKVHEGHSGRRQGARE